MPHVDIVWEAEAESDLDDILAYIAKDNIEAAIFVSDKIYQQVSMMGGNVSRRGKKGRVAGTYELVIVRTPYIAVYVKKGMLLRILRILHGAEVVRFNQLIS
ncbi:MAG: type II toxin-antitoxin system RelE/ParE family toxin [Desulfuromonadaceae bacterium]|nr:type II toxin-antitoxin system RelE/ParE family toxin [Desulfuromonadaceae bacterium]